MHPLGHASTDLPNGYVIKEDLKVEEVKTGVSTFSCTIGFNDKNRLTLEKMTNAGNYLLRSNGDENEFYTIIDTEINSKEHTIQVYAEDAGLDLINEIVGEFDATEEQTAEWYVNTFTADSGFEIGINEIPSSSKRKLSWDGESTVTARLASVAEQFDDYEVSYSFAIKGLEITNKYINLHAKRGKDAGVQLRINRELDNVITSKSVANLATAFVCEGGVPDNEEEPITFSKTNYAYDDGEDFYVDGDKLKSRKANAKWSRYVWNKEPNKLTDGEGYIVRPYSYNTDDPDTLRKHAMTELKKVCDMEVNYEVDIARLPEGTKIGDRVYVVDDAGELYVSTRILLLETSVIDQTKKATLGEHLIKNSGISEKVTELAKQFAQNSQNAARALSVANTAKTNAEEAKTQAAAAATEATNAQSVANEAKAVAGTATQSASDAQAKAIEVQEAVSEVEKSVSSLETTVGKAKDAVEAAKRVAETATIKSIEAVTAATNAQTNANLANTKAGEAQTAAESAKVNSAAAMSTAQIAKDNAKSAIDTARAAQLDAEQAERDVASFAEQIETVTDTMEADYARKTELTDTTAHLQSQISRNAAGLSSTVSLLQTIDETANDARAKADAAQAAATESQAKADEASANAQAAQNAADQAAQAAEDAQAKAQAAQAAAETARRVADQAEANLEAARVDLATVQARADATEEEIAAAQQAINTAESAANVAKANADEAVQIAAEAQNTANTAAANAWKSQLTANEAKKNADAAQELASQLVGESTAAKNKADEAESLAEQAKSVATTAQATADAAKEAANNAVSTAETAQIVANAARVEAETAQSTANEAALVSAQAKSDLANAESRLADVLADAEATAEEVAAAQADVNTAKAAATTAEAEAEAAQSAANTAKANADAAQTAATEAQTAANNALEVATEAQDAADEAQAVVDGLAVRVTKSETNIKQGQREITLRVSEVEESVSANSTNITKAESLIRQLSDSISMLVTDNNGASLMVQTENGWTFSTGALQEAVDKTSTSLGDLQDEVGSVSGTVSALDAAVKDLGKLSERIIVGSYTYTDENGNNQTEPSIDLCESDTGFSLKITNTRILFTDDSTVLAEINSKNKSLDIEKAKIKGELHIGNPIIGGRNLLLNSKSLVGSNIDGAGTISSETHNDLPVKTYDNSAKTGTTDVLRFIAIRPKLGETYTLSFFAKGSGSMSTYFYGSTGYIQVTKVVQSTGTTGASGDGHAAWTLPATWQHYWVTWTLATSGDESIDKYVLFRANAGAILNICGVKLEKGSVATEWSPAPEDAEYVNMCGMWVWKQRNNGNLGLTWKGMSE